MPGTNAGTGCPINFRCSWCRRNGARWPEGSRFHVTLTGRKREGRANRNARMSSQAREYQCKSCGSVGWSKHFDLEKLERDS